LSVETIVDKQIVTDN